MRRKRAATPLPEEPPTPLEEVARLLKEERNKWRKRFMIWGLVLLGFFVNQVRISHLADKANTTANEAKHAVMVAEAQKQEARLSACISYNRDLATNLNKLNDEVQKLATDAFADPTGRRTSAEQELVGRFLDQKHTAFEADKVPFRDCSPAGIVAFYASQGGTIEAPPGTAPTTSVAPSTTAAKAKRRVTTTTARPTTSTRRTTTSTTFRSSPTTTATPCTGITLPGGLPCL